MELSIRTLFYIFLNWVSGVGIVFANKAVFVLFNFKSPIALTLIHLLFTALGMRLMAQVRGCWCLPCT